MSEKLTILFMKIESPTCMAGVILSVGIAPEVNGSHITDANIGKNTIPKPRIAKHIAMAYLFTATNSMFYL